MSLWPSMTHDRQWLSMDRILGSSQAISSRSGCTVLVEMGWTMWMRCGCVWLVSTDVRMSFEFRSSEAHAVGWFLHGGIRKATQSSWKPKVEDSAPAKVLLKILKLEASGSWRFPTLKCTVFHIFSTSGHAVFPWLHAFKLDATISAEHRRICLWRMILRVFEQCNEASVDTWQHAMMLNVN